MKSNVIETQTSQMNRLLAMINQVCKAHQDAKTLYLDRLAPDYNVFDFIEPDERRLSTIIAWFLDPRQTHGQGGRFLSLFLADLGVDATPDECARAEVKTEAPGNGRLDIFINATTFRVAIENKAWAPDGNQQLNRYFAYLDGRGAVSKRLVYLTPKGTPPDTNSICEPERERRVQAKQLHLWSFETNLVIWLAKCRAACSADRVSSFIDEFIRYIHKEFQGQKDNTMHDHIIDEIIRSPEHVVSAMQVMMLENDIKTRLLFNLREQLLVTLTNRNVSLNVTSEEKYSGYSISYSDQSPYEFYLQFQMTQFNGLVFGVGRKTINDSVRGNEYDALVGKFGAASRGPGWLWERYVSPNDLLLATSRDWHGSTEPWTEIANGALATKIAKAFADTHAVLSACGVG